MKKIIGSMILTVALIFSNAFDARAQESVKRIQFAIRGETAGGAEVMLRDQPPPD